PNNMAICLSGDLDPEETIKLIDKYFGGFKAKPIPEFTFEKEDPVTKPLVKEVLGPQRETISIGFRFEGGAGTKKTLMIELIDMMLMNGKAGIMDLDLEKKQKVLSVSTNPVIMEDYSLFTINIRAKEGQTLEEAKTIVLQSIDKIKKGDFEEWLIDACITDLEKGQIYQHTRNGGRAQNFVDAFILGIPWENQVNRFSRMREIKRDEVIEFANKHYGDNYVVVYKRIGEDTTLHKVEKPEISEIPVNRDYQSDFLKDLNSLHSTTIDPVFVEYDKEITRHQLKSGIKMLYVENKINATFQLHYLVNIGDEHDKMLAHAVGYLPYMATNKYTPEELEQEFFKLGLNFEVFSGDHKSYVTMSGLEKNMEAGVKLFEHILANATPNQDSYDRYVAKILKQRDDNKLNKGYILRTAMVGYAKYGENAPLLKRYTADELRGMKIDQLANKIKSITSYDHFVIYYGKNRADAVIRILDKLHKVPKEFLTTPERVLFPQLPTDKSKVYFVHYDMVQAEIVLLSKSEKLNPKWAPFSKMYNEYFGSGLSSIVFQEIRESKALAYSAYARLTFPDELHESHYLIAYIGTQADKLSKAVPAMLAIIDSMPEASKLFDAAKESIIKRYQTDRITQSSIFWSWLDLQEKKLSDTFRKENYEVIQKMTLEDLTRFQQENIQGKNFVYLVLGNRESVDMNVLKQLGDLQELSLEEVFGY
ncbi:MAG: insulinase family protein, partial [Bacteroidetes bacterium]|nr:insulinase family protein [Bacteroidota bacterium]